MLIPIRQDVLSTAWQASTQRLASPSGLLALSAIPRGVLLGRRQRIWRSSNAIGKEGSTEEQSAVCCRLRLLYGCGQEGHRDERCAFGGAIRDRCAGNRAVLGGGER
jgi:hypothetical protein